MLKVPAAFFEKRFVFGWLQASQTTQEKAMTDIVTSD